MEIPKVLIQECGDYPDEVAITLSIAPTFISN